MANIDNYYRSAVTYTQSPPTTDTFSSSFNYSTAENLYGSNVLLYTGLIPTTNPLTSAGDGDKYAVDGIDIVEKVSVQALTAVDGSAFGFTDSRLTYLIPGSVYGITVWSKDSSGDYTVVVPPRYYDVFFYPQSGTYVIYFKDTSYEPMYRTADGLIGLQYAPAITCYRYCGPKGIENIPAGGGPQGPAGPTGDAGSTGPQGATGPTGSGGSGPIAIYQSNDSFTEVSTTTLTAVSGTLVTNLEPNYLYKITFTAEIYGVSGADGFNFKIALSTQNGSQIGLGPNETLYTAGIGGFEVYGQPYTLIPVNYRVTSTGWSVAISNSAGYSTLSFLQYFTTGSTEDSRSIVVKYAKASDSGSFQGRPSSGLYGPNVVVEPIKSLA